MSERPPKVYPAVLTHGASEHRFERKESTLDVGPVARLIAYQRDEEFPAKVFGMLTEEPGEGRPWRSIQMVARELGLPKGRFVEWFTTEHAGVYEAALKVVAADLAFRAMEAALDATEEDVQSKRLKVDTMLKLASRFDRARYGDQSVSVKNAVIVADPGLLGEAAALLEKIGAPSRPAGGERVVSDDAG